MRSYLPASYVCCFSCFKMLFWRGGVLASCNTPLDHIYPPVMSVASLVSTCGSGQVLFWHLVILHEIIFTRQLCLLLLLFQHVVLERWCSGILLYSLRSYLPASYVCCFSCFNMWFWRGGVLAPCNTP